MTVDEAREVVSKPEFFRDRYVLEALCVLMIELWGGRDGS